MYNPPDERQLAEMPIRRLYLACDRQEFTLRPLTRDEIEATDDPEPHTALPGTGDPLPEQLRAHLVPETQEGLPNYGEAFFNTLSEPLGNLLPGSCF